MALLLLFVMAHFKRKGDVEEMEEARYYIKIMWEDIFGISFFFQFTLFSRATSKVALNSRLQIFPCHFSM